MCNADRTPTAMLIDRHVAHLRLAGERASDARHRPRANPDAKISVCHGVGGMFAASGTIIMSNEAP
jgi:hypothetical protein